jgi:hypothetical protein
LKLAYIGIIFTGIAISLGYTTIFPAFTRTPSEDGGDRYLKYIPGVNMTSLVDLINHNLSQGSFSETFTKATKSISNYMSFLDGRQSSNNDTASALSRNNNTETKLTSSMDQELSIENARGVRS